VLVKSGIKIHGPRITIGSLTVIDENVRIQSLIKNSIQIGKSCRIGYNTDIQSGLLLGDPSGIIKISDNVGMGPFSHIGGAGNVFIGKNTIIGPYFSVHSENHSFEQNGELYRFQEVKRKGIVIGCNCWIGAKVTILDGVNIGKNSVIAAGSVVTKSFKDNVLIGGVPAKIIKVLE
jgi:acetyltransferase-like isoleucine patch superfamily enzyme